MKVGKNTIKTSGGKMMHFESKEKMMHWEKMAKAIKHGFKPTKR